MGRSLVTGSGEIAGPDPGSANMNTTIEQQKEELRGSLLSLVHGCPGRECLAADCPLFWARGMWPTQRLLWFNALGRDDLLSLAAYRQVCGKTNLTPADASEPAWACAQEGKSC